MFLLRDLVSPRTWLAMISHLAGLFMGLVVMVVVVTGLSLGFSLLVLALVGLPILGLTLRAATLYATAERARLDLMLGERIPAWPARPRRTASRPAASGPGWAGRPGPAPAG